MVRLFALIAVLLVFCGTARAERFAVIGDLPYSAGDALVLKSKILPALQRSGVGFLIHVGDFKKSKLPCTNALFQESRDQIYAMLPGRVIYTPGDNDWTDCDRQSTTAPVSELGRLDFLRRLFFDPPPILHKDLSVTRQAGYPENARWVYDGAVFATLHIVGTNDGWGDINEDDPTVVRERAAARERAVAAWLNAATDLAMRLNAKALVFAAQADVTKPWGDKPCTISGTEKCDGYAGFRAALKEAAKRFGKPVLFIHGDTSPYCLDMSFGGEEAPKLWRLNAPGDYAVIDAAYVDITGDPMRPFSVTTVVEDLRPALTCAE